MFGRHSRVALDVAFGVKFADMESIDTEKYMDELRSHLKWAYNITCETNLKEIKRHKRRYGKNIRCSKLETGDLVLVGQKFLQEGIRSRTGGGISHM